MIILADVEGGHRALVHWHSPVSLECKEGTGTQAKRRFF